MDLKLKEVAELLKVSEKTVYRWVKAGKIPCYRINHQYRFREDEIRAWAGGRQQGVGKISPAAVGPVSAAGMLERGGIYYRIGGGTMPEILTEAVGLLKLSPSLASGDLLQHLLKREEMAPTAVGNGVAFPHPRHPLLENPADESISICFLENPLPDYALDATPIHTLIIVLSAVQQRHLRILAALTHICRQDEFIRLLRDRAPRAEIIRYVKEQ